MITTSLVTICHHTNLLQYYYVPHAVLFIPVTHFVTRSLYLLISLTYFTHPSTALPFGNHLFILCIYESVSVCYICLCILILDSLTYFT